MPSTPYKFLLLFFCLVLVRPSHAQNSAVGREIDHGSTATFVLENDLFAGTDVASCRLL
jgi:hypothetical protein